MEDPSQGGLLHLISENVHRSISYSVSWRYNVLQGIIDFSKCNVAAVGQDIHWGRKHRSSKHLTLNYAS